jgi:hypothetical protein
MEVSPDEGDFDVEPAGPSTSCAQAIRPRDESKILLLL